MLDDSALLWFKSEVDGFAEQRLQGDELQLFKTFTQHFVHVHLADNLLTWRKEDVYGALYGLFTFMQKRPDAQPNVTIFNPEQEAHGWTSPHTVIYICQRDMPFLVDSLRMALNRLDLNIYLYENHSARVRRDAQGQLQAIAQHAAYADSAQNVKNTKGTKADNFQQEDFAFIQIDRQGEASEREQVKAELLTVLADVSRCVADYRPMLARAQELIDAMQAQPRDVVEQEDIDFLTWLRDGNFTFLGMAEFERVESNSGVIMRECGERRLGLMAKRAPLAEVNINELSPGFSRFYNSDTTLAFTKSSRRSTVHRAVYCDYVIVKRRNANGDTIGEARLLGLYTSQLYHRSVLDIPVVRKKVAWLIEHSRLDPRSHDGKAFLALLEGHPRTELIQTANAEMLENSLGTLNIYQRRAVRLFLRIDPFEKFASCIVYLPRENLTTQIAERIEACLRVALDAEAGEYTIQFLDESVLARMHLVFRITNRQYSSIDKFQLEQQLVNITRDWNTALRETALQHWGMDEGPRIARLYNHAFGPAYRHQFGPGEAVLDIASLGELGGSDELAMRFFAETGSGQNIMRLKLFRRDISLELSDMIPLLENLGFRVLAEHPHEIELGEGESVWMLDFTLRFAMSIKGALDVDAARDDFQAALLAVWRGRASNDGFNRLVLGARLDWRAAGLLRAYAHYLQQLRTPFSLQFIADVLAKHYEITRNLVALFRCKFDPRISLASKESDDDTKAHREERVQRLAEKVVVALDAVSNRNEDELIRQYLAMLDATLRTNYFQLDPHNQPKDYLSIKLATRELAFAPEPRPAYEVFVYSPRVEGVHLRAGKIARGGIRWSDRFEDFRTEVLGLVKAQQVKNAIIVPTGAKGGFVARRASQMQGRDELQEEGIACYKIFISGLLDITDNRVDHTVVTPPDVVSVDGEDPYLVVAADKGTATFSDIANSLSETYGHWLGDAFASGGSNGYDHKAMGITARGAWVAVQRHFRELGVNVQSQAFTVLGIGDMSGDVFGNGMLLSQQIRLVAAFNHMHIFLDPAPDAAKSFAERQRLFNVPRSQWTDYDESLISRGGGVFPRSAKLIDLSAEVQQLLGTHEQRLAPDALINRLLQAKVDLIWNGGVGTYVKASVESDAQVGDRSNDGLRVTGKQLQCKVFGEGGNLGMTQLARMEYCRHGGICNTDFIDNAGGVDCSDNEVNIKILLNELLLKGSLSSEQRNQVLASMTDEVAALVLKNNYRQTQAISLAWHHRARQHHDFSRFVQCLEGEGRLDRALEFIPGDEEIKDLVSKGTAWTRPELSVLISYAKIMLKEALWLPDEQTDPYLLAYLRKAFPPSLLAMAEDTIPQHRLANEIIATQLANDMVNRMGFTYVYRQMDSVGSAPASVARVFIVVMHVYQLDALWTEVEGLDYRIDHEVQYDLLQQLMRLGRRTTRWYLRNRREVKPADEIARTGACFAKLLPQALDLHQPEWRDAAQQVASEYKEKGVPDSVATIISVLDSYFMFPGMIDTALLTGRDPAEVTNFCFALNARLKADRLMQTLIEWQPANRWQDLARESHVDETEWLMRELTLGLLQKSPELDFDSIAEQWAVEQERLIARFKAMVVSLQADSHNDFSVVTVALRELKDVVDASVKLAEAE